MKHYVWRLALVFLLAGLTAAGLSADTLLLRDGRRVDGVLLSVRDGTVEFQERGGRRRVLRLERDEVRSIELDSFSGDVSRDNDTGSARPRGLREREVVVAANVAWVDTGIEVRSGQRVYFEAEGQVRWGSDRRDGPGGEERSPYNAGRPNAPASGRGIDWQGRRGIYRSLLHRRRPRADTAAEQRPPLSRDQ